MDAQTYADVVVARTLLEEPGFEIRPADVMASWNVLGLCGEAAEVQALLLTENYEVRYDLRDTLLKELGDVTWYAAACVRDLLDPRVGFDDVCRARMFEAFQGDAISASSVDLRTAAGLLTTEAGAVADLLKKAVYHKKVVLRSEFATHLSRAVACVEVIARHHGFTLSDVFERNNEKLLERYPDGFDRDRANTSR